MPSTPAQVAKRANVSVQSIRNWTHDYAEILSPEARGENGSRLFSDTDVEVLLTIAGLRRTGWPTGEILRRVQEGTVPSVVDVATDPPQSPYTTPQDSPLALLITAHNALQARLGSLEHTIANVLRTANEQERKQHDRVMIFIWGAVAGMVGAIVLLLAAYLLVTLGP